MTPTLKERKKILRTMYACAAFQRVADVCEHILAEKLTEHDSLYYPLIAFVHVAYARPFGGNTGVGPLDESIVPQDQMANHRILIAHRHKMHAHVDQRLGGAHGPATQLRLIVRDGRSDWAPTADHLPPDQIPIVLQLCRSLLGALHKYVREFSSKFIPDAMPEGEYLLDTIDRDKFLTKVDAVHD